MVPDQDTKERIYNLAIVGTALEESSNETNMQTNIFAAIGALENFKQGIAKLDLDPESAQGMDNLVKYLRIKLERRMVQSESTS